MEKLIAHYHLPGLFEFYEFYKVFLPIYKYKREYFYDWCDIASIYGAPKDTIFSGGRESISNVDTCDVLALLNEYGISSRVTFSNSLLVEKDLNDKKCNDILKSISSYDNNGVIIYSDLLLNYIKKNYPNLYFISSTTKVITDPKLAKSELDNDDYKYVCLDFRLNKNFDFLKSLNDAEKDKAEFLCNECCYFGCSKRKECYEAVSKINLGIPTNFKCESPLSSGGYMFSKAMENQAFIGIDDIKNTYLPLGFSNFKIEGRDLGSALLLEFIIYYMTKPEYQLKLREELYLTNMLDLF